MGALGGVGIGDGGGMDILLAKAAGGGGVGAAVISMTLRAPASITGAEARDVLNSSYRVVPCLAGVGGVAEILPLLNSMSAGLVVGSLGAPNSI